MNPSHLHHAYGILRTSDTVATILVFISEKMGVPIIGNPDFFHGKFETMTIDDSRAIKETALSRRFSAQFPRVFLIEMYSITREAQNALLKLLEEPEPGNHFFIVIPSFDILLPTLRSRLADFKIDTAPQGTSTAARDFFKKSIKDRIAFVDGIAADISDEKMPKHSALDFINSLETELYREKKNASTLDPRVFEAFARARTYMNDRAPALKMLLEYIALSV